MNPTDAEAAEIVELIVERLTACNALDVLAGIEESRQQGVEETFQQKSMGLSIPGSRADVREVGTIRRRPPTNKEMLSFVLERLHQRLVVLPAIAQSLHESIGKHIVWRVDSEFVSSEHIQELQADITDLLTEDLASVQDAYRRIEELIPEFVPARTRDV